jgi:anoctamin-8
MSNGIIEHLFPVHENKTLKWLRIIWVKSFFSLQPLDKVCDYFGVKIAMYFAWIGHYTGSLIYPAIAYSTFWVNICINIIRVEVMSSNSLHYLIIYLIKKFGFGRQLDQWTEGVWFVVLAFMNVLWLTVYLETWKRYCAELAYRWATLDQRHQFLLQPRLEFKVKFNNNFML